MEVKTYPSIEVQITLAGPEAEQLTAAAMHQGLSTAELIQHLIETFLANHERADTADWQALGLTTFESEWDNPEDAAYDKWREHYGVGAR
jgi:hypothetical protein